MSLRHVCDFVRLLVSVKFSNFIPIVFFFFYDSATSEIYTLSLHDALPISFMNSFQSISAGVRMLRQAAALAMLTTVDRKSTRLNSSHPSISYAVFCLKKKK